MPLISTVDQLFVKRKGKQRWLLVRVSQALDCSQVSEEGILIWRAGMIGNLELRAVLCRVVVDVGVAASRQPMVKWSRRRIVEVVMNIGEADFR